MNLTNVTIYHCTELEGQVPPEEKHWYGLLTGVPECVFFSINEVRTSEQRVPHSVLLFKGQRTYDSQLIFEVDAPSYDEAQCPYIIDTCVVEDKEALIVETFHYVKDIRDDAMMSGLYRIQDNAAARRLQLEKYWKELQNA